MHKEVVLPALMLLRDPKFATAEKEYLEAHEAYDNMVDLRIVSSRVVKPLRVS